MATCMATVYLSLSMAYGTRNHCRPSIQVPPGVFRLDHFDDERIRRWRRTTKKDSRTRVPLADIDHLACKKQVVGESERLYPRSKQG